MSSKVMSIFMICPPGLEAELLSETREIWPWLLGADARVHGLPEPEWEIQHGGLEFRAPLLLALQFNFFSRIATRVLVRIAGFKARDFERLSLRLRDLRFQDWWGVSAFGVEVAAAQSRLNNEKRIFDVATHVWKTARAPAEGLPLVMIRAFDDQFTVSIDTTGRHLHFREPLDRPKNLGDAPLRETLAAACLRRLIGASSPDEIAKVTLWDPMAGSGTFLTEAERLFSFSWQREFAFQSFVSTPKLFRDHSAQGNYLGSKPTVWGGLRASDLDIGLLQKNAKAHWQVAQADIATPDSSSLARAKSEPTWLICNPPYQRRLKMNLSFTELAQALSQKGAERISVLVPEEGVTPLVQGFRRGLGANVEIRTYPFQNGGLPVVQVIVNPDSLLVQNQGESAD